MLTTARRSQPCLLRTPVRRSLPRLAYASFHVSSSLNRIRQKPSKPRRVEIQRAPTAAAVKDKAANPYFFKKMVNARLVCVADDLKNTQVFEGMGLTTQQKYSAWSTFVKKLNSDFYSFANPRTDQAEELGHMWRTLHQAFQERGPTGLDQQVETTFLGHLAASQLIDKDLFKSQKAMADLRYPAEWFAKTRSTPRKIIMHVGPTNSGKTYHALKRLEELGGVYAGPLRLLAHEVYTRMNAKGIKTNLVTGEERKHSPHEGLLKITACTVEMAPLATKMRVAVIDEIQMIGHIERGWAWTQAVLGIQADEVHLCGEARSVPLIRSLAASMGEDFEVRNYERLTPLEMDEKPLGTNLEGLRPGDCIVAFSKMDIHMIKDMVRKKCGLQVAIVYGSLPPETRAHQARLFNDPNSGYDVLVASDAIGMGLNLSIKRVIFHTTFKFNGFETVRLSLPHFKQIAGRAGRFKTAHEANQDAQAVSDGSTSQDARKAQKSGGLVTAIEEEDFKWVKAHLKEEPESLKTAGIFPPDAIVERFATFFPPRTPFSFILLQLVGLSRVHSRFHMCLLKDQLKVADAIQSVEGLSVAERLTFTISPANTVGPDKTGEISHENQLLVELAKCVGENKSGSLLEIPNFGLEVLDEIDANPRRRLAKLETLHKSLTLYLWLSYRFSGVFTTRALAFKVKEMVEERIEQNLEEQSKGAGTRLEKRRAALKRSSQEMLERFRESLVDAAESDESGPGLPQGSFNESDEVMDGPQESGVEQDTDAPKYSEALSRDADEESGVEQDRGAPEDSEAELRDANEASDVEQDTKAPEESDAASRPAGDEPGVEQDTNASEESEAASRATGEETGVELDTNAPEDTGGPVRRWRTRFFAARGVC
ncbi:P-loop containing nucleoside triphosphate hydrolase protein [Phyllosticta citriasiana]|uniref:RNA helicase n=2 Tax=Phyllosticta citriasiana TaxID=595635 RepID=A0ABR1KGA7_9PEZI